MRKVSTKDESESSRGERSGREFQAARVTKQRHEASRRALGSLVSLEPLDSEAEERAGAETRGHICHREERGLGGQPCGHVHGAARSTIHR